MSLRDRLEIIDPAGEIRFVDLDPIQGLLNIGRHPDNDVVIDSPDVSAFHAVLDCRQKPYQFILLGQAGKSFAGGQPLQPRLSHPIRNWDAIELNGHTLILLENSPAASPIGSFAPLPPAVPVTTAAWVEPPPDESATTAMVAVAEPAPPAPVPLSVGIETIVAPLPDHTDEVIVTSISARDFTVDVEQAATFDVSVANGGDLVATFVVRVDGLDSDWVMIAPGQVNLYEGEQATVNITVTPPRKPTSRAGTHHFSVTVTSPEHPGRLSRLSGTLVINPYYENAISELSPRQQKLGWTKRAGKVAYTVANFGNSEANFRIDASDDERACQFEFKLADDGASLARQAELRLLPEETRAVTVFFTTLRRRFFGLTDQPLSFTVTTAPLQGGHAPRSLLGQAQIAPLIGPWHVAAIALLIVVLIAFIFRPNIQTFTADPDQVLSSEIMAGNKVTLNWESSWFARVSIDQGVGALEGANGKVEIAPLKSTTYQLTAATPLLEVLFRDWFTDTQEVTVIVDPVEPIVRFNVDRDKVIEGETVTLSWQVLNAEEIVLSINGAPETLPLAQSTGSRVIKPEGETVFTLRARNQYTTGEGIVQTRVVNSTKPTATPLPPPIIQRFDVLPSPITEGEEVTLEWSVTGVDEVTIEPLGAFPPSGKLIEKPTTTTSYRLIANNGQESAISLKEVVVNPAPTPTPIPGTPRIEFFTVTPSEAAVGSAEAGNITLAWSVTGDFTSIELEGGSLGRISGLSARGSQIISADRTTQFTLTAYNGTLSASQTAQLTITVPVPIISGLSPASKNVGEATFTLTVTGSNYVSNSVVRWDGVDHSTTFVSDTQLLTTVLDTDISATGSYNVTVFNPAPGGGASAPITFRVNNPIPSVTTISPTTGIAGTRSNMTLTVNGDGFVPDSAVRWDGADVATTYLSRTQLRAVIPSSNLATAGSFPITVFNPAPVGGISSPVNFTVNNPVPTVTAINPTSVIRGATGVSLTIVGTNFTDTSSVYWNGTTITSVFNSNSQLTAFVPDANLVSAGTAQVTVSNPAPGGGTFDPPLIFTIRNPPTNTALISSPNPSVYGQPVSFTATVTSTGLGSITGSVEFVLDGSPVDVLPLNASAQATYPISTLTAGTHTMVANYLGSTTFDPSSSNPPLTQTVNRADTTVAVTSSANPSVYGQWITLTATISITAPGGGTPTGSVEFRDNGVAIAGCSAQGISGSAPFQATCTLNSLGNTVTIPATRSITAVYSGDTNFNASPVSPTLTQTINQANVTIYAGSYATWYGWSYYGQNVTLYAWVYPASPSSGSTDGGTITWVDTSTGTTLGSNTVAGSFASITIAPPASFSPFTRTISATYTAASGRYVTTTVNYSHTVYQASTTTSPPGSVSCSVIFFFTRCTFTSPPTPTPAYSGTPTGNYQIVVTYCSGGTYTVSGQAALGSSVSVDLPWFNSWNAYATYLGDGNFYGSSSSLIGCFNT